MLQALLQTLANLGFSISNLNESFNIAIETIKNGDRSSLDGLTGIFTGFVSSFTGLSDTDVAAILSSLLTSIFEMLTNGDSVSLISSITGA